MKVLFVSNDPLILKEDSSVRARMRSYASSFGTLHIVAPGGARTERIHDGPLTLHPVHGNRLIALVRMIGYVNRLIHEEGIEVVSAQDPFEYGVVAYLGSRKTDARLHIQIHTDFLSPWFVKGTVLNRVRVLLADWVLPRARGVRVVSKRIEESLKRRYGTRFPRVSVIPLTVSPELPPATPLPLHAFSFSLMTIARLEKEKRIDDILYALAKVDASIGLFVVGDGKERAHLERLTASLGLSDRVVFLGWRTDSLSLLQPADAYIQASAYEGYGRTLIEAALAGLPIISTDVGVVGDIFVPHESVLAVTVGDREGLRKHIETVASHKDIASSLGEGAQHEARKHLQGTGNLSEAVTADLATLLV